MTDIDNKAADAAREIEDVFCRNFPGGRAQRLAAIQNVIANAMCRLLDERSVGWLAAQKLALKLPDCSGDDLAVVDGVILRQA